MNWFEYIDIESLPQDLKQEYFWLVLDYKQTERFNQEYQKEWLKILKWAKEKLLSKINDLLLIEI